MSSERGGKQWIPRAQESTADRLGAKTRLRDPRGGIRRYRDAGGKRAIVTNIAVDLDAPTDEMSDDAPFQLRCDPGTAAARLKRLADLGFDDAIFVPRAHTEASLGALRALLP